MFTHVYIIVYISCTHQSYTHLISYQEHKKENKIDHLKQVWFTREENQQECYYYHQYPVAGEQSICRLKQF